MENFASENTAGTDIYSRVLQKNRETVEVSRDFILPDFYADIKRIISSTGSISPEGCFVEGGKASISGVLSTKVLFIDDENRLRSVTFTQDYGANIPISDNSAYSDSAVICCPTLENLSVKTVNPRKVSVRGRIDSGLKVWKRTSVLPEISGVSGENGQIPEKKTEKVKCIMPFSLWERDLELSEDIMLEDPAQEIIFCDAKIEVTDCSVDASGVFTKGYVNIDVIYQGIGSSEPVHVSRRAELSRSTAADLSLLEDPVCSVCPYLRSVDCSVSDENKKIEIDIGYTLVVNVVGNVQCSYVSDMYLPAYTLKNESEKVIFSGDAAKNVKAVRVESCSESILPEGSKIIFTTVVPQIETLTSEDGVKTAVGNSLVNVVYKEAEGNFSSYSFNSDFEIELRDMPEFDEYLFGLRVSAINATNGENGLCVGYDVEARVLSWNAKTGEIIKASQIVSDEVGRERKPFTLYYPSKDDTLWDIGKKYNVTVAELMSANPESIIGEKMPSILIIPRHRQGKMPI